MSRVGRARSCEAGLRLPHSCDVAYKELANCNVELGAPV